MVAVTQAEEWLRAISDWLIANDHDMMLPSGVLDADPLDIADALARHQSGRTGAGEADCDLCGNTRVVRDGIDIRSYPETAPCPKCRDGSWALTALRQKTGAFHDALVEIQVLRMAITIQRARAICATHCAGDELGRIVAAGFLAGEYDDATEIKIALAAIMETQKACGELAETLFDKTGCHAMYKNAGHQIAAAIREETDQ